MEIRINDVACVPLPTGGLFFPEQRALIVSDLHIGKASHFRKHGIPISHQVDNNNLWILSGDIMRHKPEEVIFLGDLFHSSRNQECERFADFMANFDGVNWELVEGNHDILHPDFYKSSGITMHKGVWEWNNLSLSHEPLKTKNFNIAGHIHPGIRLKGKGKQSLRLACFHKYKEGMLLPAYGDFTGKHVIKPKKGDQIFALLDNDVVLL